MAIYGWNFNNTAIPVEVRARFVERKKIEGKVYLLQGVCNFLEEQERMAVNMHNGKRTWVWEERNVKGVVWWGCYVS